MISLCEVGVKGEQVDRLEMSLGSKVLVSDATIPILAPYPDPVANGLVTSMANPGGNITGVSTDAGLQVYAKRLQYLVETARRLANVRFLATTTSRWLVAKLPNSRRYQLLPQGYSICLIFLKLFERVCAPLMAGLLSPFKADKRLKSQRRSQLDRLYQRVIDDLDTLVQAVGLKAA